MRHVADVFDHTDAAAFRRAFMALLLEATPVVGAFEHLPPELAKERAIAVRDALVAAGVSVDRVELSKPQVTEGGADDTLARRVDITGE
jgi:hypothetical protein